MKKRIHPVICAAPLITMVALAATDFETPPSEPPSASLTPEQVKGENFHIADPVQSDGLMHHYVIESRYGSIPAYGRDTLVVRLHEIAALNEIAHTPKAQVVMASVLRSATPDAPALLTLAAHPLASVTGIPTGIAHLLLGYAAQAKEVTAHKEHADSPKQSTDKSPEAEQKAEDKKKDDNAEAATNYARRYLGITGAERRWYKKLAVDPYTDNKPLRDAVHRLARLDAAAGLPLRFVSLPRVPYGSQLDRAMDAIYNENPAALRAKRHDALKSYGLSGAEISQFEHNLLLSPTRQNMLVEIAKSLEGVGGRGELFRHAMTVTAVEEVEVFLRSAALLPALHAQRPLKEILPGIRIPAAKLADGRVLVAAAFDAGYWTADVAGYEAAVHQAIGDGPRELWLTGKISDRAREELKQRGWEVHDQSADLLSAKPAPK